MGENLQHMYVKAKETKLHTSSTASGGTDIHIDRDCIFSCLLHKQYQGPIVFIHSVVCWVKLNLHHCRGKKSDMMLYNCEAL